MSLIPLSLLLHNAGQNVELLDEVFVCKTVAVWQPASS
jgi:hypothetical protein